MEPEGKYHLAGPEEPIKAQVGSNVVLPCLVRPAVNASNATVEWMFNSSETVHLFRNEGDDRKSQDDRYKDRTYLNHAMLEHGNVSLKLSNITKNDEGIYSCLVQRLPDHNKPEERDVTLVVVDGKENENPDSHSGGPAGVIVGVGALIIIFILIFITYYVVRRHRGEQNHRGNGNQGDEAEGRPLQNQ